MFSLDTLRKARHFPLLFHLLIELSSVSVRISAEVVKPNADTPFEGLFSINLELNEMASPAFQTARYIPIDPPYCLDWKKLTHNVPTALVITKLKSSTSLTKSTVAPAPSMPSRCALLLGSLAGKSVRISVLNATRETCLMRQPSRF